MTSVTKLLGSWGLSPPIGTDHVLGNLVALVGAMLISVQTPEGTIALTTDASLRTPSVMSFSVSDA